MIHNPLSRESVLNKLVEFIESRKYNFFGTLTSKYSKTETYFRNMLFGNKYIKKFNNTNIPEHIIDRLNWTRNFPLQHGNFTNPVTIETIIRLMNYKYKDQIDFYQKGTYINEHNIIDNIFSPRQKVFSLTKAFRETGTKSLFAVLEYGSVNGYCHLHYLLHHEDIDNVYLHTAKGGKRKPRYIVSKDHNLFGFFHETRERIGFHDLQLIAKPESASRYVAKYLTKQFQGFGNNHTTPLNECSHSCNKMKHGDKRAITFEGNEFYYEPREYCVNCYKGTYKNNLPKDINDAYKKYTEEENIDTPVFRFFDFDLSYLNKREDNKQNYKQPRLGDL